MAGKSNRGRNRRGSSNAANSSESSVPSSAPVKDNSSTPESNNADVNGLPGAAESTDAKPEVKQSETESSASQNKQGN